MLFGTKPCKGNAKSNAQKETSSTKATTANAPVNNHNEKGAKKTPTHARKSAARQEENRSNQQRGFFSRVIRAIFLLAYYSAFAVLVLEEPKLLDPSHFALISPNCPNSKKPSPRFFNNVVNTYGVVLRGYRRQANSVINPVSKTIQAQWKEFGKSKFGAHVQQYVYKVHAFVAEKLIIAQTFVSKKINEVITWYNNGGDKQVAEILEPVKTVLLIIVEVVRDVALHVYEGIVYVAGRAQQFVHIWLEKGFQAALKTLN
ncbi:unnamed protein product [Caenorhabditis angaria]|uniref:Uncharacterized protein n=1 Tax=Caenorhabditis angaria TaxID=860376 RepID=A0A9P1IK75_9PELO|nr:unnamed protein product [Caenorhabditis angaria]